MHLLRAYRIQRGLSTASLARLSGVGRRSIQRLEKCMERNPRLTTMRMLGDALGLPASMIFFAEEQMEKRQLMSMMLTHLIETLHEQGALAEGFYESYTDSRNAATPHKNEGQKDPPGQKGQGEEAYGSAATLHGSSRLR